MESIPQLEKISYDWLVIGTGIEESMMAAHYAKVLKKKVAIQAILSSWS
jgi:RAB protein geranylgeranyltransferase component A